MWTASTFSINVPIERIPLGKGFPDSTKIMQTFYAIIKKGYKINVRKTAKPSLFRFVYNALF